MGTPKIRKPSKVRKPQILKLLLACMSSAGDSPSLCTCAWTLEGVRICTKPYKKAF